MEPQKEYTTEELDALVETLPDDVKNAIFSVDSAKIINEVGKKYGLHIDQIGLLAEETGNILLGISKPTEFVDHLQTKLSIERVRASEVAAEVNEKIFSKIRESLRNLRGAEEAGKEITHEGAFEYGPKKEDLLEAIERPEIYARPPSLRSDVSGQARPSIPNKTPLNQTESIIPQKEEVPHEEERTSIMAQKLSQTVTVPQQEVRQARLPTPERSDGGQADPYREAV